jgi:putative endonuclease
MEFFVYILFSPSLDKFYIGHTNNLDRRFYEHNLGHEKFTRSGVPWEMVYFQKFDSKSDACREELRIKKRKSKKYILQLINSM